MTTNKWPEIRRRQRGVYLRQLLAVLIDEGPLTARELSELCGLSVVTLNMILRQFGERGLVEVGDLRQSGRGPAARTYRVPREALQTVAVVHRPGSLIAAYVDPVKTGPVTARGARHDRPDPGQLATATADAVRQANAVPDRLRHVVVGVRDRPEPDDIAWQHRFEADLGARLGCTVRVRTNTELAALAEAEHGAARDVENFMLVTTDSDGEPALKHVIGGVPHRGAHGMAGSLGRLAEHLSSPDERLISTLTAACLVADPALVVLGGSLASAGSQNLRNKVHRNLTRALPVAPEVLTSTLEGDAALQGAVRQARIGARKQLLDVLTPPE